MAWMEQLFEDLKTAEEQSPVIPPGTYQGQVTAWSIDEVETSDGPRSVIRLQIVLQGNVGAMLSDNVTPVDGQSVEYSVFLPDERDKHIPSKYGRGTMYDVSLRKLKRLFKACGVDVGQFGSLEEALEACKGAQVSVVIDNRTTEEGILYDRVVRIQ